MEKTEILPNFTQTAIYPGENLGKTQVPILTITHEQYKEQYQ